MYARTDASYHRVRVYKFIILFTIGDKGRDGLPTLAGREHTAGRGQSDVLAARWSNSLTRKGFLYLRGSERLDGIMESLV